MIPVNYASWPWHSTWQRPYVALSALSLCLWLLQQCPGNHPVPWIWLTPWPVETVSYSSPGSQTVTFHLCIWPASQAPLSNALFCYVLQLRSSRMKLVRIMWKSWRLSGSCGSSAPSHRQTWTPPAPGSEQWPPDYLWPTNWAEAHKGQNMIPQVPISSSHCHLWHSR